MPYIAPKKVTPSQNDSTSPSVTASNDPARSNVSARSLQSSNAPALCIEPTSYSHTSSNVKLQQKSGASPNNNNSNAFTFPPPPSRHLPSKIHHRPSSRSSTTSLSSLAHAPTTPLAPSLPLYKPKKQQQLPPPTSVKPASSYSDISVNSSASNKPLSAQFLSKQPRGYPQRSPPLSPTSHSSSASLTTSPYFSTDESSSSEASSASSSTSSSSLSLDNDPILFSKLTQAVQAMALAQSYSHVAKANEAATADASISFIDSATSTPPNASSTFLPMSSTATVLSASPPSEPSLPPAQTAAPPAAPPVATANPSDSSDSTTSLCTLTPSTPVYSSPTIATLSQATSTTPPSTFQLPTASTPSPPPKANLHIVLPIATSPSAIIRKKSGERVKSSLKLPSLVRPVSMPNTPSKMVHFDTNLVHVRHFLHSERPTAVSANSSPSEERAKFHLRAPDSESETESESEVEEDPRIGFQRFLSRSEWKVALPNFPHLSTEDMMSKTVFLESAFLSSDKESLIGHIAVRNIDYQKYVCIRYSIDYWKTFTEVQADFNDDVRRKKRLQGFDRFTFAIKLSDLPYNVLTTKSMYLCVRYATAGQEFWDNNNSYNYQVDFTRVNKGSSGSSSNASPAQNTARTGRQHRRSKSYSGSLTSRDSPVLAPVDAAAAAAASRVFSKPALRMDSDFNQDFDALSSSISSVDDILDDLSAPKLKKNNPDLSKSKNDFTSRYSFGASLNATRSKKSDNNNATKNNGTASNKDTPKDTPFAFKPQFALHREDSSSDSDDEMYTNLPSLASLPLAKHKGLPNGNSAASSPPMATRRSPASFSTHKLALNAGSYQELIQNYCFFQGAKSNSPASSPPPASGDGPSATSAAVATSKPTAPSTTQTPISSSPNGSSASTASLTRVPHSLTQLAGLDGTRESSVHEWQKELSV